MYDLLPFHDQSEIVRLNRAIALGYVSGPAAVLAEVDLVAERLDDYHLLHATRAKLLTELRGPASAQQANLRALELATNPAEQDLLRSRQTAETGQLRLATCTV